MSDALKYLSDKFQTDLKRLEEDIARGGAEDFAAYKYACGVYRGLLMANNHIIELAQRLEKDDD